jgi:hypothetical protein
MTAEKSQGITGVTYPGFVYEPYRQFGCSGFLSKHHHTLPQIFLPSPDGSHYPAANRFFQTSHIVNVPKDTLSLLIGYGIIVLRHP